MYVVILMTEVCTSVVLQWLGTLYVNCVVCNVPQQLVPEGVAGRSREVGVLEKRERKGGSTRMELLQQGVHFRVVQQQTLEQVCLP